MGTHEAARTAWLAASMFVLAVLAARLDAQADPGWRPLLAVIGPDPVVFGTALVMTAIELEGRRPGALDIRRN